MTLDNLRQTQLKRVGLPGLEPCLMHSHELASKWGVGDILFESIKPTASTRIHRRVTAEKTRAQNQISPWECCIHLPTLLGSSGCAAPTRGSWILVNASSMSKQQSYFPSSQSPSKGKMTNYLRAVTWWSWDLSKQKIKRQLYTA